MMESMINLCIAVALLAGGGAVIWAMYFNSDNQSAEPDAGNNERHQQVLDTVYERYPHLRYAGADGPMSSEDEANEEDDVMRVESKEEDSGLAHGISGNDDYYYSPIYSWMPGNIFYTSDTDISGCSGISSSDDLINDPAYSSMSCNLYHDDHSW